MKMAITGSNSRTFQMFLRRDISTSYKLTKFKKMTKRLVSCFTEVMTSCRNRNGGLLRSLSVRTDLRISCPSMSCVFFVIAVSMSRISAILNVVSLYKNYAQSYIKFSTFTCTNHICGTKSLNNYLFAYCITSCQCDATKFTPKQLATSMKRHQ